MMMVVTEILPWPGLEPGTFRGSPLHTTTALCTSAASKLLNTSQCSCQHEQKRSQSFGIHFRIFDKKIIFCGREKDFRKDQSLSIFLPITF